MADEVECPNCNTKNKEGAAFCINCGRRLPDSKPASKPVKRGMPTTQLAGGGEMPQFWIIILIIMEIVGLAFIFMGFWVFGLPVVIGAGYFAYTQGGDTIFGRIITRVTILAVAMSLLMINVIPENKTISVFGVTFASIGIILTLPLSTKDDDNQKKRSDAQTVWGWTIFLAIFSGLWTLLAIGSGGNLLFIELILIPLVIVGGVWKYPHFKTSSVQLILTLLCFLPLIIFGINFMLIAGGALLGGFFDQMQNYLGQDIGISGTALDMILNPTLAVQAGLKPATTKEVTKIQGPPTINFAVTGDAIPKTGCYDSSTFQITAKVTNTGGEFIKDMSLKMTPKPSDTLAGEGDTVCADITYEAEGGCGTKLGKWDSIQIPKSVTVSRSCLIESVDTPPEIGFSIEEGEVSGSEVSVTHTCFTNISAFTGLHGVTRLPVEFIESDYGRSKFEEGQLVQAIIPGTSSIGPVELSLGGFEQPILFYGASNSSNRITMITTISESGSGWVKDYHSAFIYIPIALLKNTNDGYECVGGIDNNEWECIDGGDIEYINANGHITLLKSTGSDTICDDALTDSKARSHCKYLAQFSDNGTIGGYSQLNYDYSLDLLADPYVPYAVCFFTESIDTDVLVETGKCTMEVGEVMTNQLRRTMIIRGDILFTYAVTGEVGITVQDCDV